MTAADNRYAVAHRNRKNGPTAKSEFEEARAYLFMLQATQGNYITELAKTDDNINASSGFISSKSPMGKAVVPVQPKISSVTYKNGNFSLTSEI